MCSVCCEGFTVGGKKCPCSLPCGHTYCLSCLKSIRLATGKLECPLDRKKAKRATRNFSLEAILTSMGRGGTGGVNPGDGDGVLGGASGSGEGGEEDEDEVPGDAHTFAFPEAQLPPFPAHLFAGLGPPPPGTNPMDIMGMMLGEWGELLAELLCAPTP